MRRCNISPPSCRHKYAAPCCHDCPEEGCPNRCKNSPDRCRCWSGKPAPRKRTRKVDPLQVAWLYGQGLTQAQVAERLRCDRKTVGAILHEMGVGRFG